MQSPLLSLRRRFSGTPEIEPSPCPALHGDYKHKVRVKWPRGGDVGVLAHSSPRPGGEHRGLCPLAQSQPGAVTHLRLPADWTTVGLALGCAPLPGSGDRPTGPVLVTPARQTWAQHLQMALPGDERAGLLLASSHPESVWAKSSGLDFLACETATETPTDTSDDDVFRRGPRPQSY